jgi:alpha-beta hydrolase superfamily lysophospholipase
MRDRGPVWALVIGLGVLAILYVGTALVLIRCPWPIFADEAGPAREATWTKGMSLAQDHEFEELRFELRDGAELFARRYAADSDSTIVLLHGITGDSHAFNTSAGMLRETVDAEVITPDSRGHGRSEGRRGDLGPLGQYEDDIADVLAQIRARKPDGRLILAGHSVGGGIALRYAGLDGAPPVDAYLLFAPHLGFDSPTTYPPKPAASEGGPSVKVHGWRMIGLVMLNLVGIDRFNDLYVIDFGSPPGSTPRYTHRAFSSVAPTDYRAALESVDRPLLVLVGTNDESFYAEHYEAVVSEYSQGKVLVFEGLNHNAITHDPQVLEAVRTWWTDLWPVERMRSAGSQPPRSERSARPNPPG